MDDRLSSQVGEIAEPQLYRASLCQALGECGLHGNCRLYQTLRIDTQLHPSEDPSNEPKMAVYAS